MLRVLVTGGAGYIGSHTVVELLQAGHSVVIVDNLENSSVTVIKQIKKITNRSPILVEADVRDSKKLKKVFQSHNFDAVIHFAALKAVGESVQKPLDYYHNNLDSLLTLIRCMKEAKVDKLLFSSSATVYGIPSEIPLKETSRVGIGITNPYGQTKFMSERIIQDVTKAYPNFRATLLRYFNPVGAHESGLIGENPRGTPNNLMPYVSQVAAGKRDKVYVYGNDYDTKDGTGVRDYVHVVDLARGHLAALDHLIKNPGLHTYNLGTGRGYSVLEMIKAFSKASKTKVPYEIVGRRAGDIATCYADPTKANKELGWKADRPIDQMCRDAWSWQTKGS